MTRNNGARFGILLIYIVLCSYLPLKAQESSYGINPLAISITERESFHNKGNLVPNASFEQGLAHWTVVGKNVELTDTTDAAHFGGSDAFHSRHAVRINRSFEEPLVTAQTGGRSGGGAALTERGQELIRHYRAIERKALSATATHLKALQAISRSPKRS